MFQRRQTQLTITQTWNGQSILPQERIQIELEIREKGLLVDIAAPFYDDLAPNAEAGPCDELWDYEVVELFVASAQAPEQKYTELELGPHGHYLLLCLDGIRQVKQKLMPLKYECIPAGNRWLGLTLIPWEYLPPQPWVFNAYAIHGTGPTRRYLAAFPVHGSAPDFHQPHVFQSLLFQAPSINQPQGD